MEVNQPTIDEHIKKLGMPHTWGTHIEILAIATMYGISVFITKQSQSGIYYWEEVKPLKSEGFSYPVVPTDTLPIDFGIPSHLELSYITGAHYDSVVSITTNKVPESIPQKLQPLANMTNTIVIP